MQKESKDKTNINTLKNKIPELKVCDSLISCAKGLMFAAKPRPTLLVFSKESIIGTGIHMFFVFFPLKIQWYDSKMNLVDERIVKPFTGPHYSKKPAKYVLELPAK